MLEFVAKTPIGAGREEAESLALRLSSFDRVARTEVGPREGIEKERIGAAGSRDRVLSKVEGFGRLAEFGLFNFQKSVGIFVPLDGSGRGLLRGSIK